MGSYILRGKVLVVGQKTNSIWVCPMLQTKTIHDFGSLIYLDPQQALYFSKQNVCNKVMVYYISY